MAAFNAKNLFSKVKSSVEVVSGMAKDSIHNIKTSYDNKKAEIEQHQREMTSKGLAEGQKVAVAIAAAYTGKGLFDGYSCEELCDYTKEFFDKIVLPASSVTHSCITMHPYIIDKQLEKYAPTMHIYLVNETPLVYLKSNTNKDFLLTDQALYFSYPLEEDPKFPVIGRVPNAQISSFSFSEQDTEHNVLCNGQPLISLPSSKAVSEDIVSLNNYFTCIEEHDFVITDEEVDALIREKIGAKVYSEVKKYMVYDDELMVYFAWGIDSLSAKDYIVCTTKQIITVNREMLGATANIRQFYYEDITSASTEQNAKSNDLTVALLETALTAATKTCDLVLTVAGAVTRINMLFKVEAERVVAVYHQYRKLAKSASAQPQVVIQQQAAADPLDLLKKLSEMKTLGIITEEEFNQKKTELLTKI